MSVIRPATIEDLPRMETTAREFYASSRFLRGRLQASQPVPASSYVCSITYGGAATRGGPNLHGGTPNAIYDYGYIGNISRVPLRWLLDQ